MARLFFFFEVQSALIPANSFLLFLLLHFKGAPSVDCVSFSSHTPCLHLIPSILYFFLHFFSSGVQEGLASTASLCLLTPLAFTLLIPCNLCFFPYFFSLVMCAGAPSGDCVSTSAHNPLLQPYPPLPPSGHAQGASPAVRLNKA